MLATPCSSVIVAYRPNRTSTSGTPAPVCCSTTLAVTLCSGALSTRKVKPAGTASCGGSVSLSAKATDRIDTPSVSGAVSSMAAQYSEVEPGHGVSPSLASPTVLPSSSRMPTSRPARRQADEQCTPTLTWNARPIGTADGTSHTATLNVCGMVLKESGIELSSCRAPTDSCRANRTLHACSPT